MKNGNLAVYFRFSPILIIFFFISCSQPPKEDNDILNYKEMYSDMPDSVRTISFLNGKEVPFKTFRELPPESQSKLHGIGASRAKHAISVYGEKYRYGVVFFNLD